MYPFLHLLPDGTLFVFAAKSSQVLDPAKNRVLKTLPDLPGMYRTYPNTGGSVMLPLSRQEDYTVKIMICGGGGTDDISSQTDPSCGIVEPLARNLTWQITEMPGGGRGMVEAINLLDGSILWLNGARQGCQGFGTAKEPALEAMLYFPNTNTWAIAGSSYIPRMYHSVALMLLDGTILIAGSNPNEMPILPTDVDPQDPLKAFPTEFRVEIYTPSYLEDDKAKERPEITWLERTTLNYDGSTFAIRYRVSRHPGKVEIILYHGGFVTHALHMGQVMVMLEMDGWRDLGNGLKVTHVQMPKIGLAPGPYIIFVVVDGVPSIGKFVSVVV